MKIKELLTEGPIDFIKGLAKTRSLSGATAANQQAKAVEEIRPFINSIINSWNRSAGLTGKNSAADAVAWAQKTFKSDLSNVNPPANNTPQEINRFLTDVSRLYRAGELTTKSTAPTATQIQQPTPAQIAQTSAASNIGATGKRGSSTSTPPPQTYQSPLGITVRQSTDPVILNYNGKPYMLNNRGEWAVDGKDAAGAQASGPVQAEMDKVLQAYGLL